MKANAIYSKQKSVVIFRLPWIFQTSVHLFSKGFLTLFSKRQIINFKLKKHPGSKGILKEIRHLHETAKCKCIVINLLAESSPPFRFKKTDKKPFILSAWFINTENLPKTLISNEGRKTLCIMNYRLELFQPPNLWLLSDKLSHWHCTSKLPR